MFNKIIKINCPYSGETGYGNFSRAFCRSLKLNYNNVFVRNFTSITADYNFDGIDKSLLYAQTLWDSDSNRFCDKLFNLNVINEDINIVLNETNNIYFFDDYKKTIKIAYNIWESTKLPTKFFDALCKFNQAWVPSEWQKEMLINQGYSKDKVFVVPGGVNSDCYPIKNKKLGNKFKYLIVGSWCWRKSTIDIIRTYKKVFKNRKDVELILCVDNPFVNDGYKNTEDRLLSLDIDLSNIRVVHYLPRKEYIDLIHNAHVFLSCSRGEGWNIPLMEAIACGIPSIYSNCGGQLEYTSKCSLKIDISKEISAVNKDEQISFPGNYYEPDFDHLKHILKKVYNNYSEYKKEYSTHSEVLRNTFSWNNSSLKALKLLENEVKHIKQKQSFKKDHVFIVQYDTDNPYNRKMLNACLFSLKQFNMDIIVSSISPITLQTSDVILIENGDVATNVDERVYTTLKNGYLYAKEKYAYIHFINYDCIVDNIEYKKQFIDVIDNVDICYSELSNKLISSHLLSIKSGSLDKFFDSNVSYNFSKNCLEEYLHDYILNGQLTLKSNKYYSIFYNSLFFNDVFYNNTINYNKFIDTIPLVADDYKKLVYIKNKSAGRLDIFLNNTKISIEPNEEKIVNVETNDICILLDNTIILKFDYLSLPIEKLLNFSKMFADVIPKKQPVIININFNDGAGVTILNNKDNKEYYIKFIDINTNTILQEDIISTNPSVKTAIKRFINWKLQVIDDSGKMVLDYNINLKNKNVTVLFDSKALGDTLAWIPYVEQFRKTHKCNINCITNWNSLLSKGYPEINFVNKFLPAYATYRIKLTIPPDSNWCSIDYRDAPLQKIAASTLRLKFKEIKPNIILPNYKKIIKSNKYVVISTTSTAIAKLWNNKNGWQEVIDYLNKKKYKVVLLQKEPNIYKLKNIIDYSSNVNEETMFNIINDCKFFIGLSSGLSWLSWAMNKKVIMISGFSDPSLEFKSNNYRVINKNVCHGCWQDKKYLFDRGDGNWCPRNKNFECTEKISSSMVINKINQIL
jgi:autotransporter strand-loop-strand O-heptosyltransferase